MEQWEKREIRLNTTPAELREIAQRMETEFPERALTAGNPTEFFNFTVEGPYTVIRLCADQGQYRAHQHGEPNNWL